MLHTYMPITYIILATFIFTLLGGLVALRYKAYSHIFAGLTAGVLISVVFLEMIPEILEISNSTLPLLWIVIGFVVFHIVEKIFSLHHSHSEQHDHGHVASKTVGVWALILHSMLDGVSIGLAYQVSPTFGTLLAVGVIAHDFSDGFNTVSLTSNGPVSRSRKFLFLDAIAPAVGVILGFWITFPDNILVILLGIFGGILLYVATGDVLPEAHCPKKRHMVEHLAAMILGVAYIAVVVTFLG